LTVKIEHRVGVQAPAEAIWRVISDIESWGTWNPLYPRAEGKLRIGARLALHLALRDREPETIRPIILDWIPNEQIHWRLTTLGGLVKRTRFLEIEQLGDNACIFANGELFEGPLARLTVRPVAGAMRHGFQTMGEALKAQVEAAWRASPQAPI
jgi:hypothetical protein